MNSESYAQVKRLFLQAVELDTQEWPRFLEEHCTDKALRKEVELLLANHRPDTILSIKGILPQRPPARFRDARSKVVRSFSTNWRCHRQITIMTVVLLAAVLAIGTWVGNGVEGRLTRAASTSLENAVARNAALMRQWSWMREMSALWARDDDVQEPITRLLRVDLNAPEARSALLNSPAASKLRAGLAPLLSALASSNSRRNQTPTYLVFDFDTNTLLAASADFEQLVGEKASLEAAARFQEPRLNGPTLFLPFRVAELFDDVPRVDKVVISYAAPIYNGVSDAPPEREARSPKALLMLVLQPHLRLGDLATAGSDESESDADSFLFDAEGRLLSNLLNARELKAAGLLAPDDQTSALDVVLYDPGRRLSSSAGAIDPTQPLTRLVQLAKAGRSDPPKLPNVVIEPYHNVVGRKVIGAWTWLPELKVGLATEVDADFVFSSLDAIRLAKRIMMALVLILGAAACYSSHSAETLSQRVEDGELLGQYVLLELIGEGGLGRVYKARHAMLQRITAVKLLRTEVLTDSALERFAREVRQTSRLTHPNTIQVYDYGRSEGGIFYYAMEYLTGITLTELLKRENVLPVGRAIYILRQILGSLGEAHDVGLIHRDIKPENIMLNQRGGQCDVVKVLDFGLVQSLETREGASLTAEGMISGTPLFIAPDRFAGETDPDGRTDLYAVGTLAYRMLTGEAPFQADNRMDLCLAVMKAPVPRASAHASPAIPAALDDLIYSAMAKSADDRPPTAEAMIEVLESLQLEFPWTRRDAAAWWDARRETPAKA